MHESLTSPHKNSLPYKVKTLCARLVLVYIKKTTFLRHLFRALSFVCVVTCTIQQGGCAHTTCSCCFAQQYLFFLMDDLKVLLGNLCSGHIRMLCLISKHFGPQFFSELKV